MTTLEQLQAQAEMYGFVIQAAPGQPGKPKQFLLTRPHPATGGIQCRGTLHEVRVRLKQLQFDRDSLLCP